MYKRVVKGLVDTYVSDWFEKFIITKNAFCFVNSVELEQEKDTIRFICNIEVVGGTGIVTPKYAVYGYVSDLSAVVPCSIRTDMYEADYFVWASTEEARNIWSITREFTV